MGAHRYGQGGGHLPPWRGALALESLENWEAVALITNRCICLAGPTDKNRNTFRWLSPYAKCKTAPRQKGGTSVGNWWRLRLFAAVGTIFGQSWHMDMTAIFWLLKVCKCFKVFSFRGLRPPGPRWGLRPQTPVIGTRSRPRHVVCPLPLPGKISMGALGFNDCASCRNCHQIAFAKQYNGTGEGPVT